MPYWYTGTIYYLYNGHSGFNYLQPQAWTWPWYNYYMCRFHTSDQRKASAYISHTALKVNEIYTLCKQYIYLNKSLLIKAVCLSQDIAQLGVPTVYHINSFKKNPLISLISFTISLCCYIVIHLEIDCGIKCLWYYGESILRSPHEAVFNILYVSSIMLF